MTLWPREAGDNQEARREVKAFNDRNVFTTPKPGRLMTMALTLAADPGDLVLNCFASSGATGSVAHKMCGRWIMVASGGHRPTHSLPLPHGARRRIPRPGKVSGQPEGRLPLLSPEAFFT
ncbi:MAG: DNA methyltransferase [Blastocatellia bacterium]